MRKSSVAVAFIGSAALAFSLTAASASPNGLPVAQKIAGLKPSIEEVIAAKQAQREAMQPLIDARKAYLRGLKTRALSQDATTITACKNKKSGVLAIKNKCSKKETSVTWNVTGPQGSTGAQGGQGPQGPAGSNATAPLIYEDFYTLGASQLSAGVTDGWWMQCSEGGQAINGGFETLRNGNTNNNKVYLNSSYRVFPESNRWEIWLTNTGTGTTDTMYGYVYCQL